MGALHDLTIPLLPDRYYHIFNRGINKELIFFNENNYKYFLHKYAEKMTGYFETYGYCLLDNHFHLFVKGVSTDILLNKAILDFNFVNRTFFKEYVLPWLKRIGWQLDPETLVQAEDLGKEKKDLTNFQKKKDLTNFQNLLNLYQEHGDTQSNLDPFPLTINFLSFKEQLCSYILSERFRGFMLGYAKAINKQQERTGSLFQKAFRRKYIPDDMQEKKQVLCYIHHNPIHHHYSQNYEKYKWSSYNAYLSKSPTRLCRDEALQWFDRLDNFIKYSEEYQTHKKSYEWNIEEY